MSQSDTKSEPKTAIEIDYDLPHPPEKVWRALTESSLVARWLMPNDFVAEVGHKFTFRTEPKFGFDGIIHCEVMDVDAPRLLRYRWIGGTKELTGPYARMDTVVTWRLEATATGTRLRFSHTGFLERNAFAVDKMGGGWTEMIRQKIPALLTEL